MGTNAWEIQRLIYYNVDVGYSVDVGWQYVISDMLNKYFIAQITENTFILHWKKVKTGISDLSSPGEIEIKISRLFFFKPTPIFSYVDMKVVGNSIVRFFEICLWNLLKAINQEDLSVCWHLDVS